MSLFLRRRVNSRGVVCRPGCKKKKTRRMTCNLQPEEKSMAGRADERQSATKGIVFSPRRAWWVAGCGSTAPAQRFAAPPRPRRPQPLFYYKPPALRPLLACSIFPPCAAHTTTRRPAAAAPRRPGSRAHQSGPPRLVSPAPLPQVSHASSSSPPLLPSLLCCLALPLSLSLCPLDSVNLLLEPWKRVRGLAFRDGCGPGYPPATPCPCLPSFSRQGRLKPCTSSVHPDDGTEGKPRASPFARSSLVLLCFHFPGLVLVLAREEI